MMPRRLAAAVVLVLAAVAPSRGQPADTDRFALLHTWLSAVERHSPGETDGALILVGGMSTSDVIAIWTDAQALLVVMGGPVVDTLRVVVGSQGNPVDYSQADLTRLRELATTLDRSGGRNRLILRGAMLHADIAMLAHLLPEHTSASSAPPAPGHLVTRIADGEYEGTTLTAPHWQMARTLLDNTQPDPAKDETVRLWYRATLTHLQSAELYDMSHVKRALQLFPDDPMILLQAGCLHEVLASRTMQLAIRSIRLPRNVRFEVGDHEHELQRAYSYFRRALRADPDLTEARIRLGRVATEQGARREAIAELQKARAATKDPLLLYYAGIFLGAAEDAQGNRVRARAAYEAASALYPRAQSARLALSRLSHAAGNDEDARRHVDAIAGIHATNERHDPWWTYPIATGRHAPGLLSELYRRMASGVRP